MWHETASKERFPSIYSDSPTGSTGTLTPRSVDTWQPTSPTKSMFRNRVPMTVRRWVPLYIMLLVTVMVLINTDVILGGSPSLGLLGRRKSSQDKASSTSVPFPRKIWQTWKVDPLSFEERDFATAKTWTVKNPDYRYEVLTDLNAMTYVEQAFGSAGFDRPDIVDFYSTINATIIKADLLRYMVLYAEGGVYADIDVEALKPVSKFIPDHRYNEDLIDMVVGVEIDQPRFKDHRILGPKSQSFCQWTFMARPQLPVMMRLIEGIMTWLHRLAMEQRVSIAEVELDFDAVISGTGPSAFTKAILEEMNEHLAEDETEITWDDFHDIDESKIVSRILVLNVEAFAAGQGHSDSGNHDSRGALVKHHYHASNWPSRHPRFSHPVYGPVEACNWEPLCILTWDQDVDAFSRLSSEEQRRLEDEVKEEEAKQARLVEQGSVVMFPEADRKPVE